MSDYGKLTYDPATREWVVEARPHVALRLKRCFAKVAKGEHGSQRIADTRDTARDLAWFLERFPLQIAPEIRAYLESRKAEHIAQEKLVHDTLGGHVAPPPFELALPLREYQKPAAAAALALRTGGLLLADEMGLGKTASAIGVFARPEQLPALVVTLTALPEQWRDEIKRFAPNLRTHILTKGSPYDLRLGPRGKACTRHRFLPDPDAGPFVQRCAWCLLTKDDVLAGRTHAMPDVLISNYHKLVGWADVFGDPAFGLKTVVFDEGQELRHGESAKYTAAKYVRSAARTCVILTGTPIYNHGIEFFNVLEVVQPDVLGTRTEFVREWCRAESGYGGNESIKETHAFGHFLRENGIMLRRTRAEVGRELPRLQTVLHRVEAEAKALDAVQGACAQLAKIILAQGQKLERGQQFRAAEEFSNKLRLATGIAKAPWVAEFVRMVVESGEPVVLFGWHHAVYDIWKSRLYNLKPVLFTGLESPKQKQAAKAAFLAGETKLLIMSLRAGAGIDGLQKVCCTAVFGELDYSPGVHAQDTARIFRDGQEREVIAYYPYADVGSDPVLLDILGVKQQQLSGVLDPTKDLVEELTVDVDRIKKLAAHYLQKSGLPISAAAPAGAEASA